MNPQLTLYLARARADDLLRQAKAAKSVGGKQARRRRTLPPPRNTLIRGIPVSPETKDKRWIALYVLCAGMLMIVLDATIVNVALPTIQSDLHFSQSGLAWVVNGYLITFGGLLLLAGRLGDLIGRRRMFLCGLTVFTAASTVCGLASSQGMLIAARFAQGAGGAMTSSVILGMIVTMFNEPKEQAKAIGVFAFVASAGGAIGLLVGGVLTQAINWHWIFFVNLPIGVGTAVLARRLLEAEPGIGLTAGADVCGAVLSTGALMLTVYAIVKPAPLLGIAAGVLAVAFLVRESTAATPLIPLRIVRSRNVSGANLIQVLTAAGMFGVFFLGALYVRRVLHYNALQIGLAFFPVTVLMGHAVGPIHREVHYPLRCTSDRPRRDRDDRRGDAVVQPRTGARELRHRRAADDDAARDRLRRLLPIADDTRDVRRHACRRRARLGAREHDRPGRRRARARGAGLGGVEPRTRLAHAVRDRRRLPRRVPDRSDPRGGGDGSRVHHPGRIRRPRRIPRWPPIRGICAPWPRRPKRSS